MRSRIGVATGALLILSGLSACRGCRDDQGADSALAESDEVESVEVVGTPHEEVADQRCDSGRWHQMFPHPLGETLSAMWSSGPTDVWIAGGGELWHFNGRGWACFQAGRGMSLIDVWGNAAGDVWAVGNDGVTLHYDGDRWSEVRSGTPRALHAVWGSGADSVWAVGDLGTILHWNGQSWSDQPSSTTETLRGVWGSGPSSVVAVGNGGTILRWDGDSWSQEQSGVRENLSDVWGWSDDDLWAAGDVVLHWDGASWTSTPTPSRSQLSTITGSGETLWAAGSGGTILRWDGSAWQSVLSGTGDSFVDLWSIEGHWVWAVGASGELLAWDGAGWRSQRLRREERFHSVFGRGQSNVWVASERGLYHFDGLAWRQPEGAPIDRFSDLWVSGVDPTQVWAVGWWPNSVGITQYDGQRWSTPDAPGEPAPYAVWGGGPDDVWLALGHSQALHFDGQSWSSRSTGAEVVDLWSSSADAVWGVGASGKILRWDGRTWSEVASGTTNDLRSIWGNGVDDIWAVGDLGTILHWDGQSWTASESESSGDLFSVWSCSDEAWAVGHDILRFDGLAWTVVERGVRATSVWGAEAGDVWVTTNSAILRLRSENE